MSRDLYLSFSTNTLITADNTQDFTVNQYYYSGATIVLENKFDSNATQYGSDGYELIFSAFTQNKVIWEIGLFDQPANTSIIQTPATNSELRGNSFFVTANCGCGLIEVVSNNGPCNTTAYAEVKDVTPDQAQESIIHNDLTQVTSINGSLAPAQPSIVLKVFNSNYPSSVASGDTVTATLYVTGVTYVTGGAQTTYTDTITLTHPGWATNPSPEINFTYNYLPNTMVPIYRGSYRFQLQVSTNNQSSGDHLVNKYARAYLINNTCG